uniref:Uncharacterized protein n=1 Tax=Setaria viridis TaxID=4556 RepID=A0A4U6W1A4_SETVI|nr:hypothetical protein SEVIR_2G290201v2 [Setaria viridis]
MHPPFLCFLLQPFPRFALCSSQPSHINMRPQIHHSQPKSIGDTTQAAPRRLKHQQRANPSPRCVGSRRRWWESPPRRAALLQHRRINRRCGRRRRSPPRGGPSSGRPAPRVPRRPAPRQRRGGAAAGSGSAPSTPPSRPRARTTPPCSPSPARAQRMLMEPPSAVTAFCDDSVAEVPLWNY